MCLLRPTVGKPSRQGFAGGPALAVPLSLTLLLPAHGHARVDVTSRAGAGCDTHLASCAYNVTSQRSW